MSRIVSRHDGSTTSYTQATSRHGKRAKPNGQGTSNNAFCCNRCRKPLSTTVFVCKCDCIFCEDCTYAHFNDSSFCPACGTTLGADDFLELCISDPSTVESAPKAQFQAMLTKSSADATNMTHQDLCRYFMSSMDNFRRTSKFVLKQMVMHGAATAQRSSGLQRAYQKLQAEHTQQQQAIASERREAEQSMQELENRNTALNSKMQEMERKMKEYQRQLAQFREHFRQPGSSHSCGSGSTHQHHRGEPHLVRSQQHRVAESHPPPPMQAFVKNKAMAAAAAAANRSSGSKRTILGQATNFQSDSFSATPIQLGRQSSEGSGSRVRDIRSTSAYSFGAGQRRSGHSPAMIFSKSSNQGFR